MPKVSSKVVKLLGRRASSPFLNRLRGAQTENAVMSASARVRGLVI